MRWKGTFTKARSRSTLNEFNELILVMSATHTLSLCGIIDDSIISEWDAKVNDTISILKEPKMKGHTTLMEFLESFGIRSCLKGKSSRCARPNDMRLSKLLDSKMQSFHMILLLFLICANKACVNFSQARTQQLKIFVFISAIVHVPKKPKHRCRLLSPEIRSSTAVYSSIK